MTFSVWLKIGAVVVGAMACFLGGYQGTTRPAPNFLRRSTVEKKLSHASRSSRPGRSATPRTWRRIAVSVSLMLLLGGCATKTPPSAVKCPEPPEIPAHLVRDRSESAADFSTRVQSFLSRAREFASKTRATSTRSDGS